MISINISRKKFVICFLVVGFAFLFITTSILGTTGPRGFPQSPDSLLRTGAYSPIAWKRLVSAAILPVKVVLIGPLALPPINILKEDPPPPFIGIYLIFYWSILAVASHYILGKVKSSF